MHQQVFDGRIYEAFNLYAPGVKNLIGDSVKNEFIKSIDASKNSVGVVA